MSFEVGSKVTGKVTGITNFGAFIDLGNRKTGLVHISEVSATFVKDINEVLKVGDEVTVKVISVSPEGKISLSIRQASDEPVVEKQTSSNRRQRNEENGGFEERSSFKKNFSSKPNTVKQNTSPSQSKADSFDAMMSAFLKDSDDRLLSLKRNTEGKRGGRGGRRS